MTEHQQKQEIIDYEHLRLLSIFDYILGGIMAFFACFPIFHIIIGIITLIASKSSSDVEAVPPDFIGWFFIIMGGAVFILGWLYAISLILAGRFIARRKHRIFCLVIAIISCLSIPWGTLLGVFTIIVLMRPSVKMLFEK